ncbi:AI-2E family transporter [Corynebacterium sp. sy017]|uniref:AI-2E family transporter n=2 Tax=unclassified Corynebacterium TaxID=2624378 RepID=UPI00118514CF|nr:AI-2E family transporter [Corynebacterium sp. sy017]TSD91723.1 AI-2E family transporter [Corynebacterium sp. SY003]
MNDSANPGAAHNAVPLSASHAKDTDLIDIASPTADHSTAANPIDRAHLLGSDMRRVAGWAMRFIITAIAAVIAWKGLALIWTIILPIILALLVTTVLWPPVRWLRARKVPASLATISVILGFFLIIGGVFSAIAPMVTSQSKDLFARVQEGIHRVQELVQQEPLNLDASRLNQLTTEITNFLQSRSKDITSGVFSGISTASSIAVTLVLVLILTFFFLKDGDRFLPTVRSFIGPGVGWHISEALTRVWNTLTGFIRTQAIVSLVDAILIGIGLLILKVPLALALAVITFFAGFIPIVGAFTAGALAVLIALVSHGLTNAILVLVLIVLVQQIEGNVLQPILQSKAMNLHPAIVLLSVTLGSTLFGVIGAFLAVPVAATVAVLIRYHSELIALRAGEITLDDVVIATTESATPAKNPSETWNSFRERLSNLGKRQRNSDSDTAKEQEKTAKE